MSKSRIKQITGYVNSSRPVFSRSLVLKSSVLAIILVIAFGVRLLPIRWGYFLSEFDPHYHYRQTKYIIDNGLYGENGWLNWHDYMSWYPWGNRMSEHTYPGLPLTAAALYFFLNALGVPLVPQPQLDPLLSDPVYVLCVLFPVILGTITCLVMYFLGRDLGGEAVGLFAALFLALDSSYIARTSLGFFDDETVGIFSILLFILFFIRSIDKNKSSKTSLFYAVAAGLSLGYLCASWGASRYPIVMTALYALVLLITRRYSRRLLSSYAITYLMALSISANVPRLGTNFVFEVEILAVYAVLFLLCFAEINSSAKTLRKKLFFLSLLFSLLAFFFIFLWSKGMIGMLGTKFLSVLNPFVRFENPLVESVAEHRPSAWGTFYYNWGVGLFFLPVGLFFATTMATNIGIYMIIYGLTSLYFASSMIRITLLLSPVVSLLWALASVRLMRPFILFLREPPQTRRKMRFRRVLGKETAAGILILMFVLFTLTYVIGTDFVAGPLQRQGPRVYTQAFSPTTIGASGMSIRPPGGAARDWVDTLIWMRENLPPSPERPGEPGTVVASWWDYGYWITTIGNRSTLADNGTWNNTQIEQIGRMFMSNETEAVEILKNYNVTHVVVFTTLNMDASGNWRIGMAGGDEGKWQWMAKIPGLDDKSFGNYTLGTDWVDANGNGGP
ncbi:MAG: glycosyltransferase family 39 protein, partial [Candidatus Bathyarchaeota archaeon]|nr:glycosyltransferase family 39 protein [Candidatus Bathyarchaeota archaeon]